MNFRISLYAEVEDHIGHRFRDNWSIRQIIEWAAHNGGRHPGVILHENTAEFAALAAAVRAQPQPQPLRGGTEFTPVPVCQPSCPTGCH